MTSHCQPELKGWNAVKISNSIHNWLGFMEKTKSALLCSSAQSNTAKMLIWNVTRLEFCLVALVYQTTVTKYIIHK